MNKTIKILFIILLFIPFLSIYGFSSESVDNEENFDWLNNYINIDPSDDLYYEFLPKNYLITKEYVTNLKWHQEIDFFIDEIDDYNLKKNINILPRFPFVFMLYGGYSYNRGFDINFLFRVDDLANTRIALTSAFAFKQNGKLWFHNNIEYPVLLNYRMKLLGTFSFYTSSPQYQSAIARYHDYDENPIMDLFNKIWETLSVPFYRQNDIGFYFVPGFDFRIPFIETNLITTFSLNYQYDFSKLDKESLPDEIILNRSNLNFNIKEEIRFNRFKQTATIPVGVYLSAFGDFSIPTTIGPFNNEFRFRSRIEAKFNKKIFREFGFKSRLLIAANYNISEDFSGDPYVKGLVDHDLTGWFALIANLEAYIPLVNVDMKSAFNIAFKRDAKFVLFLTIFADGGFTIENYNYYLNNFYERKHRNNIKNSIFYYVDENGKNLGPVPGGQFHLGNGHYLLPAISTGGGIHIYPYFLHFILRIDVAVSILKAIYYGGSNSLEFVVSFTQTF